MSGRRWVSIQIIFGVKGNKRLTLEASSSIIQIPGHKWTHRFLFRITFWALHSPILPIDFPPFPPHQNMQYPNWTFSQPAGFFHCYSFMIAHVPRYLNPCNFQNQRQSNPQTIYMWIPTVSQIWAALWWAASDRKSSRTSAVTAAAPAGISSSYAERDTAKER